MKDQRVCFELLSREEFELGEIWVNENLLFLNKGDFVDTTYWSDYHSKSILMMFEKLINERKAANRPDLCMPFDDDLNFIVESRWLKRDVDGVYFHITLKGEY